MDTSRIPLYLPAICARTPGGDGMIGRRFPVLPLFAALLVQGYFLCAVGTAQTPPSAVPANPPPASSSPAPGEPSSSPTQPSKKDDKPPPLYDSLHRSDDYGLKSLFDSLHPAEGSK